MTRKNVGRLLLLTLLLILLQVGTASARVRRIHFRPGATSASVTGRLRGMNDKVRYVIRVRAGQNMLVRVKGYYGVADVNIVSPSGQDGDKSAQPGITSANPTEAGDYRITVIESPKGDPWRGTFRLTVTVH